MSKHKKYTSEQKFQIVKEDLDSGTSITEICKRYSNHPNNFYNWQKIFFDSALEGFNKPKGCTVSNSSFVGHDGHKSAMWRCK